VSKTRSSASTPQWRRSNSATSIRPGNGVLSQRSKRRVFGLLPPAAGEQTMRLAGPQTVRNSSLPPLRPLMNLKAEAAVRGASRVPGEPAWRLLRNLLLPYLRGAAEISIVDPYIRAPHQGRNLVDLLAVLASAKDPADEISVTLVTKEDKPEYQQQQLLMLKAIQDGAASVGIKFNVRWDESIHDRSIRATTAGRSFSAVDSTSSKGVG